MVPLIDAENAHAALAPALVIDAMELIYSGKVQGTCIVASDCDYIGLAARIQEAGLAVYGFGQRNCTMEGWAAACDAFVFLDDEPGGEE